MKDYYTCAHCGQPKMAAVDICTDPEHRCANDSKLTLTTVTKIPGPYARFGEASG